MPLKIQARKDSFAGLRQNVAIDGLLCLLGNSFNNRDYILSLFNGEQIYNPYFDADSRLSLDYRFLPNIFSNSQVTLSYLVSRLDGLSYEVIEGMIERSIDADISGNSTWVLDGDPSGGCDNTEQFTNTKNIFDELGVNYEYNINDIWITDKNGVIGYSSQGVHAEDDNPGWSQSDYIQHLNNTYANGALFNTFESFNGESINSLTRRYVEDGVEHGLMTEFTLMGGTLGVCHAYEPDCDGVLNNYITFPAYSIGYSFIDAAYMGMEYLTRENIIVGDPLTRIYNCDNTVLSSNTTIGSGDYECDVIVPQNITLTIESGSTVNFRWNASLKIFGTLDLESNAELNFDAYSKLIIYSSGTLTAGSGTQFVFSDHTQFIMDNDLEITSENNFVFNDESEFIAAGILDMGLNSSLTFNNKSILTVSNEVNLSPGTNMAFNNDSKLLVNGKLKSLGNSLNKVVFTFSNSTEPQFEVIDGTGLNIDHTIINQGGIKFQLSSDQIAVDYLNITNTIFNNPSIRMAISLSLHSVNIQPIPIISNCTFNGCIKGAISLWEVSDINIEHTTINLTGSGIGIGLLDIGNIAIKNCSISGGLTSIKYPFSTSEEDETSQSLIGILTVEECTLNSATGVQVERDYPLDSLKIINNQFLHCNPSISINYFTDFSPDITNNTLSGSISSPQCGISLSNGTEALVQDNTINNTGMGLNLSDVTSAQVLNNNITSTHYYLPGILLSSSNGQLRNNTISGHSNGVYLANSSPDFGGNTIFDNKYHGIYIGSGSLPNMEGVLAGSPPSYFPLSGYNDISNNGGWQELNGPNDNDGSEIYIVNSNVIMRRGCNSIVDNRTVIPGNLINTQLLMNSNGDGLPIEVRAEYNFWDVHPVYDLSTRFGSLIVFYDPFYNEPCAIPEGGGSGGSRELLLTSSGGDVIDTVYSLPVEISELTETELLYASAEEKYLTADYTGASTIYNQIVNSSASLNEKLKAYQSLYRIGNLTNKEPGYFEGLYSTYNDLSENTPDSLLKKIFRQLSTLCLVSKKEYIAAINKFDEVIQQNPQSEEAVYAEIDAITTALLLPPDSTLGKGRLGKYIVNDQSDYITRINNLLKNGRGENTESMNSMPTEFHLEQNFPNPFNPVTKIKYSIPNFGKVNLVVYDILGREVIVLADEVKEPGYYEVSFNASHLSSGVYIYRLSAGEYVNSKKMLLLK